MKICKCCNKEKSNQDFSDGQGRCKQCRADIARKKYNLTPTQVIQLTGKGRTCVDAFSILYPKHYHERITCECGLVYIPTIQDHECSNLSSNKLKAECIKKLQTDITNGVVKI